MAPNQKPIVNSIYEIAENPRVRPLVDKGSGIDIIFMQVLSISILG